MSGRAPKGMDANEDGGAGLPAWLRDRRYLNPLLAAYDDRIATLESQLQDRAAGLAGLKRQVRAGHVDGMYLLEWLIKEWLRKQALHLINPGYHILPTRTP